jgi:hypothetical protein
VLIISKHIAYTSSDASVGLDNHNLITSDGVDRCSSLRECAQVDSAWG